MEHSRSDIEELKLELEYSELERSVKPKPILQRMFGISVFSAWITSIFLNIFDVPVPDLLTFFIIGVTVVYSVNVGAHILIKFTRYMDRNTRLIKWLKSEM